MMMVHRPFPSACVHKPKKKKPRNRKKWKGGEREGEKRRLLLSGWEAKERERRERRERK